MGATRIPLPNRRTSGLLVAATLACFAVQLLLFAPAGAAVPVGRSEAPADARAGVAQTRPSHGEPDRGGPCGVLCGAGVAFAEPAARLFKTVHAGRGGVPVRFASPAAVRRPAAPAGTPRPFSTGPPSILA